MKKLLVLLLASTLLFGCSKTNYSADTFSFDDFAKISVGSTNKELKKMMETLESSLFCEYDECYSIDLNLRAIVWAEFAFEDDVVKSKEIHVFSSEVKEVKKYYSEVSLEKVLEIEFDSTVKEVEKKLGKGFVSFQSDENIHLDYIIDDAIISLEFENDKLSDIYYDNPNPATIKDAKLLNQIEISMSLSEVEKVLGTSLTIDSISEYTSEYVVAFGDFNLAYFSFTKDQLDYFFSSLDSYLYSSVDKELIGQIKEGMTIKEVEALIGEGTLVNLYGSSDSKYTQYAYQVDDASASINYHNGIVTSIGLNE